MWNSLSSFIIKFRILFLFIIAGVTFFMAQNAVNVEYSVERAKILPSSHQVFLDNQNFQNKYGNNQVMAIAISDSLFFNINRFLFWDSLCSEIKKINGVENIISVNNLSKLEKNSDEKRFETSKWFNDSLLNQEMLDSLVIELNKQKFYDGFLNDNNDGALVLIDLDSEIVISKNRDDLVFSIKEISEVYSKKYNVRIHYSGMPYMRSVQSVSLKKEIILFVFLTLLITSLILYLFFRSFKAMFVSVIVVVLGVIFAFGFIEMFDYKISAYKYKPLKVENILCGRYRPNYFPGVADIIIRLFSIINPDKSYFGKKDYQQYIFIKTLIKKLGFKSKVISSKTIREKSGLAMSSRNQYLSIEEMKIANKLYKFLRLTKKDINDKKNISKSLIKYKNELLNAGFTKIDYLEVRTDDLRKANINSNNKRLFAAVFINENRLIDNIKV